MTSQASYKFLQPLRRTANLQPKVVTMQVSGAALARDGRATMTALIGAGMFGVVPHPIASLGSYRHDRCESSVGEITTQEQVAHARHKLESERMGGDVL